MQFIGKHYLVLEDVSRVFDASDYREKGFRDPVSAREYGFILEPNKQRRFVKKSIALHEIQYFDFALLDTSAISVYDFSKTFDDYHNEDMETVVADTEEQSYV